MLIDNRTLRLCARDIRRNTCNTLVKRSPGNVLVTGKRSKGPILLSQRVHIGLREEEKSY
jgi:hypothetical protein